MTRMPLACLFALTSAVQQYQWLPGLDLFLRVTTETKEGYALLGYDRDTGLTALLVPEQGCYVSWTWKPSAGKGAIRQIVQVGPRLFALYHESGLIRIEPQPDHVVCVPLMPPA